MLLNAGLFIGMEDQYLSLIFTMETKWEKRETDLAKSILRLI